VLARCFMPTSCCDWPASSYGAPGTPPRYVEASSGGAAADRVVTSLKGMSDGCDTGICGGDVPPLVGSTLTGTGLTLDQAATALERGEALPGLTAVQRRLAEEHAVTRAAAGG
jgi:hypothetical protein